MVRLLGRDVPVINGKQGMRALDGDKGAALGPARAYVEKALGAHLPAVRRAMEALAVSVEPAELNRTGFRFCSESFSSRSLTPSPSAIP